MSSGENYAILAVEPTATPEEIKRAYFRLVKQHSPENDPERFMAIRSAYETLSNAGARQNYDAMQQFGDEITNLFAAGEMAIEEEDWHKAENVFKRIVVLNPTAFAAWNYLGISLMHQENYSAAERIFSQLLSKESKVPLYHSNYAHALIENEKISEGREAFQRAISLEKHNAAHYISISHTYRDEKLWAEAIDWIEKAIHADGKADENDFDAFVEMAIVYLLKEDTKEVIRIAERAKVLLPEDINIQQYGSYRFAQIAIECLKNGAVDAASAFFSAALHINPKDKKLREYEFNSKKLANALKELERLQADDDIIPGVKFLATIEVLSHLEGSTPEMEKDSEKAIAAINTWPHEQVFKAVARLNVKYPNVYLLNPEFFSRIRQLGHNRPVASSAATTGCCLIPTALTCVLLTFLAFNLIF